MFGLMMKVTMNLIPDSDVFKMFLFYSFHVDMLVGPSVCCNGTDCNKRVTYIYIEVIS